MSKQDTGQQEDTGQQDDGDVERYESGQIAEKPEPTDEQKEKAAEMSKSYAEDRPTTVLPGSGNTVTGKAVNDWVDDDGNPVHGEVSRSGRRPRTETGRSTSGPRCPATTTPSNSPDGRRFSAHLVRSVEFFPTNVPKAALNRIDIARKTN